MHEAVVANVKSVVAYLRQTPVLAKLMDSHNLVIKGAYYDFESGQVTVLQ